MIELRHDSALATSAELLAGPLLSCRTPDGKPEVERADVAAARAAVEAVGTFSNFVLRILWDEETPEVGKSEEDLGDGVFLLDDDLLDDEVVVAADGEPAALSVFVGDAELVSLPAAAEADVRMLSGDTVW